MCIWALSQEMIFLEDPKKEFLIRKIRKAWPKHLPTPAIKPGPVLTFPDPAYVPRNKQVLYTKGMRGWFHPDKCLLLQATFGDTQVDFTAMGLWDSHPDGRVGEIVQRSPRTHHAFLRNYFLQFDSVRCHMAHVQVRGPATRFMDNAWPWETYPHTHTHRARCSLKFCTMPATTYR